MRAEVVISHAGVGSILCALPRRTHAGDLSASQALRETVDDHQAELAEALAERGSAIVAWKAEDLLDAVELFRDAREVRPNRLVAAVRATILSGRTLELSGR